MTPYASGKRWTLYHADCADVIGGVRGVDAVIGDPPYGMDYDTDSTRFSGGEDPTVRRGAGRNDWPVVHGDAGPFDPSPWLGYPRVVLFGANHYAARLPVGTTLVWLKRPDHLFGSFLSDAEIAWMKGGHGVYVHRALFPPPARSLEAGGPGGGEGLCVAHPMQKPVGLLSWCMDRAKVPLDGLVFDGWAGSASCGVAALRSGRRYVGCELDAAYLPIAARRLAQAEADGVPRALFNETGCAGGS